MLRRLTNWCYHHRWKTLAFWVVGIIALAFAANILKDDYTEQFTLPGSESQRAFDFLEKEFPEQSGDQIQVVFEADAGINSAAARLIIEGYLNEVSDAPDVESIQSPYGENGENFIASDGTIGYATIQMSLPSTELDRNETLELVDRAQKINDESEGVTIELGGFPVVDAEFSDESQEFIGVIAAIIILLIAFGSVIAAGLPIAVALTGIAAGAGLLTIATGFLEVPDFSPLVATLIGLGVGIDYALLVVTRYRTELHDGKNPHDAMISAGTTAGKSVVFAGTTVVVSMLGIMVMRFSFLDGMAVGAASFVLMVMFSAITLLPALLGFVGKNIDKLRIPKLHKVHDPRQAYAYRWSREVQRRPWITGGLALSALIVLSVPVLSLNLGVADAGNGPDRLSSRRAYDLLVEGFGAGFNGPLILAADLDGNTVNELDPLIASLESNAGVATVLTPQTNESGTAAVLPVILTTSPQAEQTEEFVNELRDEIIPQTMDGTGIRVDVAGGTAIFLDFSERISERLPWFIGVVILVSFIILMAVFRSLVVPIKAAIMNLLSVSVAYGVIVAIFQWGWLKDIFDIEPAPVEAWIPMMLFAFLFGLSMDYEVFLISRIREEYLKTGDNASAVADGLAKTARVITAAAAIMIIFFLSFLLNDQRPFKLMGMGLATAIFIDATIVRMILVPSTMELLGKANWWMPRWLDRLLPNLDVEGTREGVGEPPAKEPIGIDA